MRRPRRYRKPLAAGAALALGFVGNVVFAEWLAQGTGTGYARAMETQALTTTAAQATASLYPGGTGDLVLSVHNPNSFPVTLASVELNGTIRVDKAACGDAHGVSFAGYTGNHSLPASATTELVLQDVLTMDVTSADACQGAVFEIPVSLNGGTSSAPTGSTWYLDADEDAFGDPAVTLVAASAPPSYVAVGGDCDDSDPSINPDATEVAGDNKDNDCDGEIDEA
jgi:hypothetical protein